MNKEEISQILAAHKLWWEDSSKGKRADFSGANLREANLREANLSEANLSGANLYKADLYKADLYKADLRGANLSGANLREANLCEADLRRADFYKADLSEANLYKTDLSGANLCKAYLFKTDLSEADLRGANLSGADLSGANIILTSAPGIISFLLTKDSSKGKIKHMAKEVLMFKYESSDGTSQFRDVELLQSWMGFPAGQKIPRLEMMKGKVGFYWLERGSLEFTLAENAKVVHIEGEASLDWQAQVAFEASDVGQEWKGDDGRRLLSIAEVWKEGWITGATR